MELQEINIANGALVPIASGMARISTTRSEEEGSSSSTDQLPACVTLHQTQIQVGEVVDIMRINVDKMLENEHKILDLDRRADNLTFGALEFGQQATKLKRKYWWENFKAWLIIGVVIVTIIVIIIVSSLAS